MKRIPYGRQNIDENDIKAVNETLKADFLTQGPRVEEFEQKFAEKVGSKYAIGVSNGTAALHLSAMVLGVSAKSKVITTPITFAASANCIKYCGGQVTFADIDPTTALIDLNKVEHLLKTNPAGTFEGIIPVDFAGYPVNMQEVHFLAQKYNLWILEDSCHAPGGYYIDSNNQKQYCGNNKYADLSIFSFHPVKHIACGEGGMITTNNELFAKKLRNLRSHGITKDPVQISQNPGGWYYEMLDLGFNYRMPDINAALGISQLTKLDWNISQRKRIAQRYNDAFEHTEIKPLPQPDGHALHLYVIEIADRKGLFDYMVGKNIFVQVHYIPVHTLPYYQQLGYKLGSLPNAENYYAHCLSIPIYPTLTDEEQEYVINTIFEFHGIKK